MTFNDAVRRFMELFDSDENLQTEYLEAEADYPGSIEIRETVVENVLIPFAKERGFEFTVDDVRKYETKLKLTTHMDVEPESDEPEDGHRFWLLDHGWEYADSKFKQTV